MKINRYSNIAPAEFTPISAQEIMTVPIAKQTMENEQVASTQALLSELYNVKSTVGDSEVVNKEKAILEDKVNQLASSISKYGINNTTTEKIKQLKQEYAKALSISGKLGQANAWVEEEKKQREAFFSDKNTPGWGNAATDWYDILNPNKSAWDAQGNYRQSAQVIPGMPEKATPTDLFMKRAKDAGYIQTDPTGVRVLKTNESNLAAIKEELLAKFKDPGSDEYKIAQLLGLSEEEIIAELDNAIKIGKVNAEQTNAPASSSGSGNTSAGTSAQQKADEKEAAENAKIVEDWSAVFLSDGQDIMVDNKIPNLSEVQKMQQATFNRLERGIKGGYPQAVLDKDRQEIAKLAYIADTLTRKAIENTPGAAKLYKEIQDDEKELLEMWLTEDQLTDLREWDMTDPKRSGLLAMGSRKMDEYFLNKFPGFADMSEEEKADFKNRVVKYIQNNDKLESYIDDLGKNQSVLKVSTLTASSTNPKLTTHFKNWSENAVMPVLANSTEDFNILKLSNNGKHTVGNTTNMPELRKHLQNNIKVKGATVTISALTQGSDQFNNPGFIVKVNGGTGEDAYEVEYVLELSDKGMREDSSGLKLLTEDLVGPTDKGRSISRDLEDYSTRVKELSKYSNIISAPSVRDNEMYNNSNSIKAFYRSNNGAFAFASGATDDNTSFDIMKTNKDTYQMKVKKLAKDGKTEIVEKLSLGDIASAFQSGRLQGLQDQGFLATVVESHINKGLEPEPKFIYAYNRDMPEPEWQAAKKRWELKAEEVQRKNEEKMLENFEEMLSSDTPFETTNYYDFFKLAE